MGDGLVTGARVVMGKWPLAAQPMSGPHLDKIKGFNALAIEYHCCGVIIPSACFDEANSKFLGTKCNGS